MPENLFEAAGSGHLERVAQLLRSGEHPDQGDSWTGQCGVNTEVSPLIHVSVKAGHLYTLLQRPGMRILSRFFYNMVHV